MKNTGWNFPFENNNIVIQTDKETLFSYFWDPYKKIWDKIYKYEEWVFKIWFIKKQSWKSVLFFYKKFF